MTKKLSDYSKEELLNYIEILKRELNNGKYGLFYDREIGKESYSNKIPILNRVEKLDFHSDSTLENILIEGDNLLALSALNTINEKEGMINIITIDPPYNTGNDGFTFRDGFQHSEWLYFMEKRLVLAKELLKENGIIFINIDHNEHYNLKLLCDKIFGGKNFISDFVWINNTKGRQIGNGGAVKTYENILLYAKNSELVNTFQGDIRELSKEMPLMYKNKEYKEYKDDIGKYVIKNELYNTNSAFNEETRPNLVFNIFYNEESSEVLFGDVDDSSFEETVDSNFILIKPHVNSNGEHKYHAWRWSRNKIINEIDDLHFEKQGNTYKIFTKIRDMYTTNLKDVITNSTNGNSELNDIIGKGKFSYPKPVKLIKRLIQSYENTYYDEENDLYLEKDEPIVVLDFFAGSGTTAQAVLELNEEDNKKRIFIINTLNEVSDAVLIKYLRKKNILSKKSTKKMFNDYKETNDYLNFVKTEEYESLGIARAVTYERLMRLSTGKAEKGFYHNNKLDFSLRYYKVDLINEEISRDQNKYNLVEKCDGLLNIKENIYDRVNSNSNYNIYQNSNKAMAIYNNYYEKNSFDQMIIKLASLNKKENIVYYFSLDNNIDKTIEEKVKLRLGNAIVKPIPSKIFEIYQKIFNDLRREF